MILYKNDEVVDFLIWPTTDFIALIRNIIRL